MFLNNSRCRVAERCLSSYYWSYLHGGHGLRSKRVNKNLTLGNLVHGGLEALYKEEPSVRPRIEDALKAEFPDWEKLSFQEKNEWIDEVNWAEKVVGRYDGWREDRFAVVGVEQSGAVVLGERCYSCGVSYEYGLDGHRCGRCGAEAHHFVFRLDLLVRDDYGYAVVDHKTTSSGVDQFYLDQWDRSFQLWGYCYGAQKMSGHDIRRYYINIIRKVKAAVEPPDLTKSCPGCGRRKTKGCLQCADSPTPGRVSRPPKAADIPFVRVHFPFNAQRAEWFVQARVRLANKINEHIKRLAEGDELAFPHNPNSVGCDPDLCLGRRPNEPIAERFIDWDKWDLKGPDYVTEKRMAFEEGQ
jgi:hypothetical protein